MAMRTPMFLILACHAVLAQAAGGVVYRCPGPPVLYTSEITDKEAKDRGCRTIENAPITVVAPPKPRPISANGGGESASRAGGNRVDPNEQRARDSDARKILEGELKKEEDTLAAMQKDFNNGEPERQGGERNYQRYLDRVEEMRAAIARKQADIAAIKREMGKLPAPRSE